MFWKNCLIKYQFNWNKKNKQIINILEFVMDILINQREIEAN